MSLKDISGAEAVIRCLIKENVDILFGYPGGAIMPVYDEFYKFQNNINHILTRHEQGAVHAAQGYARVSGKVGVCVATSGPGATNLVTGIADAQIDSTPLVCITGQVASSLLGSDAFQETDIIGIATPVTKWSYQITKASEISEIFSKAFFIAKSGRPGPVLIDITKDAQFEILESFNYKKTEKIRSYNPVPQYDDNSIIEASKLINNSKKPLVVFGQGVILGNAEEEFKNFIEKADLPSAWTILGLSALPTDHYLNVGMVGMHGNYGPNVLTNECDLLIAVGMRFDDRVTGNLNSYAKQAKIIHFEIDPAEVNKNVKVDLAIVGDVASVLKSTIKTLKKNKPNFSKSNKSNISKWWEQIQKWRSVNSLGYINSEDTIKPQYAIQRLYELTKNKDTYITTEVGQHQMWAAQHYKFDKPNRWMTSGGLGTMGYGLPAAVGVQIANPNKLVIDIAGEASVLMTMQEMSTAVQYSLPIKIFILNNEYMGMVRQWQELLHDKNYSESYTAALPDFVKLAEAYGCVGIRAKTPEELDDKIIEMINTDRPVIFDCLVDKAENCFPMIPSGKPHNQMILGPKDQEENKITG